MRRRLTIEAMPPPQTINLTSAERPCLRSAMRDVQVTIGDYYECTAASLNPDDLATRVRANVTFVQVVNDLLLNEVSEKGRYGALFTANDPSTEVIQAFKYVRNVMQHVLHPVLPETTAMVGGPGHGLRGYCVWQEIPTAAHNRLRAGTKLLKPMYDRHLHGLEVTGTMLDAARFFAIACPDVVHLQPNGEWTGFPLAHQAGVGIRLHPEEPGDPSDALQWMASRRPGGDLRVVCGRLHDPDRGEVVFGFTFADGCAFVPFFEAIAQVKADIGRGYRYHEGDVRTNTSEDGAAFGSANGRSARCSGTPMEEWLSNALIDIAAADEYTTYADLDWWRGMWATEAAVNPQAFITRRERRLNAGVPC